MSYWRDLADRQKSYWKDLAGRIATFVKRNYRTWGAALCYLWIFVSQSAFILFLTKDINNPIYDPMLLMPLGIAIGIVISIGVVLLELCFLADYHDFKERQAKIHGELWRRRQEE